LVGADAACFEEVEAAVAMAKPVLVVAVLGPIASGSKRFEFGSNFRPNRYRSVARTEAYSVVPSLICKMEFIDGYCG
jgi:hypothetical protein